MKNQEVTQTISFAKTPRDGRWYEIAKDQYIKWSIEDDLWNWMLVDPVSEKCRAWNQYPDGTELYGVKE